MGLGGFWSFHILVTMHSQDERSSSKQFQLRNRKHFPCIYRVIETRVEVWAKENAVGTRATGECFHSFFEFSQTFTSVSITR